MSHRFTIVCPSHKVYGVKWYITTSFASHAVLYSKRYKLTSTLTVDRRAVLADRFHPEMLLSQRSRN